jgi:hypothetical protein
MQEDAARSREVLGDDGVQETRGDATLDDDSPESRPRRRLLVVVKWVAVAGQLGEQLDVTVADRPGSRRDIAYLARS